MLKYSLTYNKLLKVAFIKDSNNNAFLGATPWEVIDKMLAFYSRVH